MVPAQSTLLLLLVAAAIPTVQSYANGHAMGAVTVDNTSFDKMLTLPNITMLTRIDKSYSHGEKEFEFRQLCKLAYSVKNFLITDIHVQDHKPYDNLDMQQRFGLADKDLPAFLLFKNGSADTPIRFRGFPNTFMKKPSTWDEEEDGKWKPPIRKDITVETLALWLHSRGVPIPSIQTIHEFDEIAKRFMSLGFQEEHLLHAKRLAENEYKDDPKAPLYIKVMERIKEKGDVYIEQELARIEKVQKGGKMTLEKERELFSKSKILHTLAKYELQGIHHDD